MSEYKFEDLKIKIENEEHSKEVQSVLFDLGYSWCVSGQEVAHTEALFLDLRKNGFIYFGLAGRNFHNLTFEETTLQGLKDRVVLKRSDVNDATHRDINGRKFFVSSENKSYKFMGVWARDAYPSYLTPLSQVGITWRDAFRLLADGKEVEILLPEIGWVNVNGLSVSTLKLAGAVFRIAPEYKELSGKFTKDQLLEIAGEMK